MLDTVSSSYSLDTLLISNAMTVVSMLILTYLGEIWNELTFTAMIGQIWALPLLICLVALNLATINRWALYAVLVLLLIYPNAHPIQVGWNSRNSNAVRSRTVSAACYNMFVQAGGIISSNIYRAGTSQVDLIRNVQRKRNYKLTSNTR